MAVYSLGTQIHKQIVFLKMDEKSKRKVPNRWRKRQREKSKGIEIEFWNIIKSNEAASVLSQFIAFNNIQKQKMKKKKTENQI